jgi:hypothetical protein
MKSVFFYAATCIESNNPVLVKIDFMDFKEECCLDFKNLKIMKVFYDESEAKNFMKLHEKE